MSDLEKALERYRDLSRILDLELRPEFMDQHREVVAPILDAARRFANLTSPETIEKAAFGLWVDDSKATPENYAVWNHLTTRSRNAYLRRAEAVLRAVEED